jgi:hypothetical protein
MFGQKIKSKNAEQQEPRHQRIPVTPLFKQGCPVLRVLIHHGLFMILLAYFLFLFAISEATNNPIARPISNPNVVSLKTLPINNPTTIAITIAMSLLRFIGIKILSYD